MIFENFLKSINWKNQKWIKTSNQLGIQAWLTTTYPAGFILIQTGFKLAENNLFVFGFTLDRTLRLQLTFYKIYFPVQLSVCHRHHLAISHGAQLESTLEGRYYVIVHNTKAIVRLFCGHYPSFLYYPDNYKIEIGIVRESNDDTFIMHSSFSVIDEHVITSLQNQR